MISTCHSSPWTPPRRPQGRSRVLKSLVLPLLPSAVKLYGASSPPMVQLPASVALKPCALQWALPGAQLPTRLPGLGVVPGQLAVGYQ